jgi:hypothetical protein
MATATVKAEVGDTDLETDLAMMKIYAMEKAMGVGPDPEKDLSVAGETVMAKDMEAGPSTGTETAEAAQGIADSRNDFGSP